MKPMATKIKPAQDDWQSGWELEPLPVRVAIVIGGLVGFPIVFAIAGVGWWIGL